MRCHAAVFVVIVASVMVVPVRAYPYLQITFPTNSSPPPSSFTAPVNSDLEPEVPQHQVTAVRGFPSRRLPLALTALRRLSACSFSYPSPTPPSPCPP